MQYTIQLWNSLRLDTLCSKIEMKWRITAEFEEKNTKHKDRATILDPASVLTAVWLKLKIMLDECISHTCI